MRFQVNRRYIAGGIAAILIAVIIVCGFYYVQNLRYQQKIKDFSRNYNNTVVSFDSMDIKISSMTFIGEKIYRSTELYKEISSDLTSQNGHFIKLNIQVTNNTKSSLILDKIKIKNSASQEFIPHSEIIKLNSNTSDTGYISSNIIPRIPQTFSYLFDINTDNKDLTIVISNPTNYEDVKSVAI